MAAPTERYGGNDMTDAFIGTWTYRSFRRDPNIDTEFNDLRFGAGTMVLEETGAGRIGGTLGGPGWSLGLTGWCSFGNPNTLRLQGHGEIGGEPWTYDYLGYLAPPWPNGVDERPSILGTIVRTIDHSGGAAPAGFVASWIAVKV